MNLTIVTTPQFKKSVKNIFKRYRQIVKDLAELEKELLENLNAGIELGHNCFKIKLKNFSIPVGKSGGFRVIYFLRTGEKISLLEIYLKSDLENIEEKKLIKILEDNNLC